MNEQELQLGKIPPQAVDIEAAIIGQCLQESSALMVAMGIVKHNFFYKEAHKHIFTAMEQMAAAKEPVDILTVANKLKSLGTLAICGGHYAIAQLTNNVGTSANIERHCLIVSQKYMGREIIRISSLATAEAYNDTSDVFDVLEDLQKSIQNITKSIFSNQAPSMKELVDDVFTDLEKVKETGESEEVLKTGMKALDAEVQMKLGDYICIAARPSMGKTTLAIQLSKNFSVLQGIPTLFFSLEMKDKHLVKNMMCQHLTMDRKRVQKGDVTQEELSIMKERSGEITKAPLYIISRPGISILEAQAVIRRYVYEHGVKVVIIDYLQRMKGSKDYRGNRDSEVGDISNGIKDIAMELNILTIPLCQLSRAAEKRGKAAKPLLSDLRESGSIEMDADVVMFPHRPSYYGVLKDEDGNDISDLAELVTRKNRDGALCSPQFTWNSSVICFDDRDEGITADFEGDREDYESEGSDDLPF